VVLKPVRDEGSRVRVYLCGRPTVECRQRAISEASLGGGQGRLLLAFLGTRRTRPVSRPEVIEALWGSRRPPSVEALRVYAQCRELFRDELGADPSTQTTQVFLSILKTTT
jgi:DNA-binding SARP family transcriptional activator